MKELPKNLDMASLSDDEFRKLSRRKDLEKLRIRNLEYEKSEFILKHIDVLIELTEHTCDSKNDLDSSSDFGQTMIDNCGDIRCGRCYLNAIKHFNAKPYVDVHLSFSDFIELRY